MRNQARRCAAGSLEGPHGCVPLRRGALVDRLDAHCALLERGLPRMRIEQAQRQSVDTVVEVERDEHHVARYALRALHHHHGVAAARHQARIAHVLDAEFIRRVGVDLHVGDRRVLIAVADLAGLGPGVEMLDHASAVQPERKLVVGALVVLDVGQREEPRLAIGIGEDTVGVEPRRTAFVALAHRPLDAAGGLDLRVGHAGDVEIPTASLGELFHLLERGLRRRRPVHRAALSKPLC